MGTNVDETDALVAQFLGRSVARPCSCGRYIKITCLTVEQRVCTDCGGLHLDAVFVGACIKCEQVLEERATIVPHDEEEEPS